MAICTTVKKTLTIDIVMPITRLIYESKEIIEDFSRWVDNSFWENVDTVTSRIDKFCRDLPWPLDMFCSFVTVIIHTIVAVFRVLWTWFIDVVAKILLIVVGSFIDILIRAISWTISFLTCLVTDIEEALASLLDAWKILVDAVGALFDVAIALLDGAVELLGEIDRYLDAVIETLGWVGVILAPAKAVVDWIKGLASNGREALSGLKEFVKGALMLDPCRMARGASDFGMGLVGAGASTGFLILGPVRAAGYLYSGLRGVISTKARNDIIVESINKAFGVNSPRSLRSLNTIDLDGPTPGRKFGIAPYRMYVSSESVELDLRQMHRTGAINLYALAGYPFECADPLNQPDGEVVYADSPLTVTFSDIRRYLRDGRGSVPEFWAFAIKVDAFKSHLELATRKSKALGVQYKRLPMGVYRAHKSDHIPLNVGKVGAAPVQMDVFIDLGRNGVNDDLSVIPVVAHFRYIDPPQLGLATRFEPDDGSVASASGAGTRLYQMPSGVTYRSRSPNWMFRWVLAHELGHYIGLEHNSWGIPASLVPSPDPRSLDEIMYSPDTGEYDVGSILFEFLFAGGEPRFTIGDVRAAWNWITRGGKSLLP